MNNGEDPKKIYVVQGERSLAKDNKSLGKFHLDGIPPAPRGVPQIEVSFDVDANGIMNIEAADKSTGKVNNITITNDKGRLSKEDIDDMIKKAEEFKEEDEKKKENIEARNGLENFLYNLKNSMNKTDDSSQTPEFLEVKTELDPIIEEGLKWMEDNESASTESYNEKQKELQEKTNPLMTKLYGQNSQAGMSGEEMPQTNNEPELDSVD